VFNGTKACAVQSCRSVAEAKNKDTDLDGASILKVFTYVEERDWLNGENDLMIDWVMCC
jgi:hypothetical protein